MHRLLLPFVFGLFVLAACSDDDSSTNASNPADAGSEDTADIGNTVDSGDDPLLGGVGPQPFKVTIATVLVTAESISRIGWDVEVVETPTGDGVTYSPNGLTIAPITIEGITGTSDQLDAIEQWAKDSVDQSVGGIQIQLRGLDGEFIFLQIGPVTVPSSDFTRTTLDDGTESMAKLVVQPNPLNGAIFVVGEGSQNSSAVPYPCIVPGTAYSFTSDLVVGGFGTSCFPQSELAMPSLGSHGTLELKHWWTYVNAAEWATRFGFGIVNDDAEADKIDIEFKQVTGQNADETPIFGATVTMKNAMPTSVTYYDPSDEYGAVRMFSLTVHYEGVE